MSRLVARGFDPDARLTIAHGYTWITAASFAKSKGLPLHLVVHDNVPDTVHLPGRRQRRQLWGKFKGYISASC